MLHIRCTKCGNKAIYYRVYSGEKLCNACFCSSVMEKVKRTIAKFNLLKYGDRIGVAVSGGKDSLSLLKILNEICKPHASKLYAITIDEGIFGYREEAIGICKKFIKEINVPHYVFSFRKLYGFGLDDVIKLRKSKISACSICGILRRRALDIAAKELDVNVIATAHNLDDIIQTFMINILNGDTDRIRWLDPEIKPRSAFIIRRVKPLMEIYEKEIAMYAFLNNIPFQTVTCPYMNEGIRSEIRFIINALEDKHPGVKYNILNTAI
ncbi:MAG: tRNA 2-thiocytidine biosynthesis TtcA family protein, partial [Nitrososphaerales archaeon]